MYRKVSTNAVLSRQNVKYVRVLRQRKDAQNQEPILRALKELDQLGQEDACCPFIRSLTAAHSGKTLQPANKRPEPDPYEDRENDARYCCDPRNRDEETTRTVLAVNNDVNNGLKMKQRKTICITFDRSSGCHRRIPPNPNESALGLPFSGLPVLPQQSRKTTPFQERPCNISQASGGGRRARGEQPAILGRRLVAASLEKRKKHRVVAKDASTKATAELSTLAVEEAKSREKQSRPCARKPTTTAASRKLPVDRAYSSLPRARTMYPPALTGVQTRMPPIKIKKQSTQTGCYPTCVNPLNLEQQEQLFFQSGCTRNPIFEYEDTDAADRVLDTYPEAKVELLPVAIKIMEKLLADYGSESRYLEETGGPILTLEETQDIFGAYIRSLGLESLITITFAENTVSPTTILHDCKGGKSTVVIGLPIEYRQQRIQGVLDHEIGTHFLRKFNDGLQVWAGGYRRKYELKPYMTTEEGFAAINQLVHTVDLLQQLFLRPWSQLGSRTFSRQHSTITPPARLARCPLQNCTRTWRSSSTVRGEGSRPVSGSSVALSAPVVLAVSTRIRSIWRERSSCC